MTMTYRTEKVTVLRDWKLALMNMFLQLCVISWVIYSLFDQKTYIESEVPTGVVSSWGLGGTEYTDKQVSIYNGEQSFCNNLGSYAFNYSVRLVLQSTYLCIFCSRRIDFKVTNW